MANLRADGQRRPVEDEDVADQPAPINDKEIDLIDRQRQQTGRSKLDYYQARPSGPKTNRTKLQGGLQSKVKKAARRRLMVGLGVFLAPTMLGLGLLMLAQQAGLTLTHINRIVSATRFGASHLQIAKRTNHINRTYNLLSVGDADQIRNQTRAIRKLRPSSLVERLVGIGPEDVYKNLLDDGYQFRYQRWQDSSWLNKGRLTLVEITDPNGRKIDVGKGQTRREIISQINQQTAIKADHSWRQRVLARRSAWLLSKQVGLPFLRFQAVIDRFKTGRGPPNPAVLTKDVSDSMLKDKRRIRHQLDSFGPGSEVGGPASISEAELDDYANNWSSETANRQPDSRQRVLDLRSRLLSSKVRNLVGATSKVSLAVGVITIACVLRELAHQIRDLARLKVHQSMDAAATVITTTSQIKAGNMSGEVVTDLSQRFLPNFDQAADYQVLVKGQPASAYINNPHHDFSNQFSLKSVLGTSLKALLEFSQVLGRVSAAGIAILPVGTVLAGAQAVGFDTIGAICKLALNEFIQWTITLVELGVVVVGSIATGGVAGGGWVALKAGGGFALQIGAGMTIDRFLISALMPDLVDTVSGVGSTLSPNPGDGAINYANVSWGALNLSQGQMLAEGGSRQPALIATDQTLSYLDWDRQQYANRGWLSHLFDLDNPYSIATEMAVNGGGVWSNLGLLAQPSWPSLWTTATANNYQDVAQILYPGQTEVIGFSDEEVDGVGDFDFIENSIWVEDNLDSLRTNYANCLTIGVADFLLDQSGIADASGQPLYDDKCDTKEARRYKIYYQDCNHIHNLSITNQNLSPMFEAQCDYLLPADYLEGFRQPPTTTFSQPLNRSVGLAPVEPVEQQFLGFNLFNLWLKPAWSLT